MLNSLSGHIGGFGFASVGDSSPDIEIQELAEYIINVSSLLSTNLAEIIKGKREIEVLLAQQLHDGLQVVFAVAGHAHGVALNLGFNFG
jgi:hypothetical protein